ncbi:YggS family pyridoxal phosphate-dependent enzyme [Achromobacter xylosoxidans]|jgi:pyridoxal phosphate enzyme (YggS family)|uniref:YggS family pyridoxal phosphate-dependent enzyme n=1 Tax=Achromobacter TaxID=222 RepID=UPI0006C71F80|nr:YggS family pyridoxal phosphate-dependent enzyme [Achromobacter xylosoxidans]MCM2572203.1 YggS family pyridoxal phosphate-dependent enzyme [Achromobacter xylosoxidans]OMG76280.1 YggS family pyridoxal phosphate enzyme [Achromobacter xylosoxidans]QQE55127.1 YggS family pyridoxal phosphate-dependent enzyme [Achromobacter xylosoxidans]QQV14771.1 YggS family pyridoxal phosphate-dependent enzyme [Achromobacter xylosoxidans]UXL04831.1 YggS family pyridoxal phosphate-dependent enzyme [Achromobacter
MTEVDTMAIRLAAIRQRIAQACERAGRAPDSVTLLPVSKTFEVDAIREAMALGLARFGENKTQELRQKAAALAGQGLQWVLIGHLQTNKAKDAARDAAELQSLDRIDLAEALHRRLVLEGRTLDVLVQVKTSSEPSKYGMAPGEVSAFLRRIVAEFPTLRVRGLMTMAVNSPDPGEVRACFRSLRELRDQLRQEAIEGVSLERLSMGMSGDFELAIEEGSTEVRIGTAIFGARSYPDPQ